MKEEVKSEIIKLLRTGKFTIATHDRGTFSIYVGRYFDYDSLPEKADYEVVSGGSDDEGYLPAIVSYLVEALGGFTESV